MLRSFAADNSICGSNHAANSAERDVCHMLPKHWVTSGPEASSDENL